MYNGTLPPPFISDIILKLANKAMEKYNGIIGKSYSLEEISKHNKKDDCWIIVNNKVYDITEYLLYHPGGPNLIFKRAGNDATDDFEGMFHSRNAKAILEKFYIGKALITSNSNSNLLTPNYKPAPSSLNKNNSPFLIPQSKISTTSSITSSTTTIKTTTTTTTPVVVVAIPVEKKINIILSKVKIYQKTKLTENTYHYLIEIPEKYKDLEWISPLTHVSLTKYNNNKEGNEGNEEEDQDQIIINNSENIDTFKSYTPIKQSNDKKYLEFLIKGYENGNISKHIHQLAEGDYLLLKGPIQTNENFNLKNQQNQYLLMIAGGTGITPMIQIILETLKKNQLHSNSSNNTSTPTSLKFILIYSSNNENDIIYKNELDELSNQFKDRLIIHYVITKPINKTNILQENNSSNTKFGRINQDLILSCLEPIIIKLIPKMITDSMETLVCGPLDFNKSINNELLKIGFKSNQIHILE